MFGDTVMAANPELGIASAAAKHAPMLLMMPLIGFSILLILIAIIVISTAKSKTSGIMILMLGLMVGGGAFYVMERSESH